MCEEVAGGGGGKHNHSTVRAHEKCPLPRSQEESGMGAVKVVVSRRPAEMRGEKEIKI